MTADLILKRCRIRGRDEPCRLVVKDGMIVASTETQTRQPWREQIEP